jgi:acetylglutamate kinase
VRRASEEGTDLGFVGAITHVNTTYLRLLLDHALMPVIAPVGVDEAGQAYNINADVAAAEVAKALHAEKLVYLSDVEGVVAGGTLIHSMTREEAARLIQDRIITNGMIPKIRSASNALESGVNKVHLIDGRIKHSLLLEIFTDAGIGTELLRNIVSQTDEVHA